MILPFRHGSTAKIGCILLGVIGAACGGGSSDTESKQDGDSASEFGALFVEVVNPNGNPVSDARVTTDPETERADTDSSGTVLIADIDAGFYRITASHERWGSAVEAERVRAGEVTNVSLTLDGMSDNLANDTMDASIDNDNNEPGSTNGDAGSPSPGPVGVINVASQVESLLADAERPYLYALDRVNNSLHFINTGNNTVEKSIFVGSTPVDMDVNLDNDELFIANFGSTEIAVVDLETQKIDRTLFVDTSQGTWDGNPYRLAVTAYDTFVFTGEDQWCDLKLVNATNGGHIAATGSLYQPDLATNPERTTIYVGESGSTGSALIRYDVSQSNLAQVDESGDSSTPYGSRLVVVSGNGEYVFYAKEKLLATNLQSVLGQFGEIIYATNYDGTIAIGETNIFHGTMFNILRPLPVATTVMALGPDDRLYLYDNNRSEIVVTNLTGL